MSGSNQTIMELDFMEEKLRRLGLGSDATVDPLKGKGKEFSEAYMERIRTEQKDRQRLRREKEYRKYMSSDQYLKEGNLGAEGKVVQAVVDSARYALAAEKKRAEELIRKVDQKEEEKYNQTARFEKEVAIEKKKIEVLKNAAAVEAVVMSRGDVEATLSTTTAPLFFVHPKAMMAITRPSEGLLPTCKPPRSSKKHHMAIELCCDVVKALINLTFLVSDNRFLLGEELTGKPVKSLDQELKVSEWSNWVQCCLYKKPLESQEPPGERRTGACLTACSYSPKELYTQELERELGRAGTTPENAPPSVPFSPITAATDSSNVGSPSALAEGSTPMSVEGEMTAELFSLAANFEEIQEVRGQSKVIEAVARFLQREGRRLQKIAVDDIRRLGEEHDKESSRPVSASLQTGDFRRKSIGSVITFVDPLPASLPYTLPIREEVLPHWTHRMPFAATIVHGDELSGVRLLKEAIERQVCRASSTSLSSGLPSKGTPGGGAGTGSVEGGSSETPLSGASSSSPSGVSSGGGAKPHDKQTAVGQHCQEKLIGVVRVEDGIKTIFITPRTLLGRAQPMAIKDGANKGTSRHTSGGGTKGAPHHRSLAEDDERKDYEAMTEVLSREIVKAHFHNLYVLTAGKVPPIQHNAVAPAPVDHTSGRRGKSSTNGGGSSGSKKLEELKHLPPAVEKTVEDESLHCLYLVGFPENEVFYQTLEVRLGPAIEAAEMTLVLEQQRLDEQAAVQMACTLSASRTRSRSGSIVPKAKTPALSGSPGKVPNSSGRIGKGTSKNAAVEDTPSLIAQLHAKKVFPPVCILGFFVEYDIPARHRRLKEAYLPWSSSLPSSSNLNGTSVPTASSSGPTLPSATTTGAKSGNASPALFSLAGGTLLNTGIPYLLHPIYNPEHSTLSSPLFAPTSNNGINLNASAGSASLIGLSSFTPSLGASTATTRELLAARSSSEKIVLSNNLSVRNDNAGASMVALNLSSGGSAGGGMGAKKKMAAADWDMATLRRELVQRHYKMKQWKAQWMAAMSAPSMMLFRRLASGPQIQSPKEKSKKRGQKSSSGGSSLPVNNNSPTTSLPMSTSNNIKEGFPSNVHGIGTTNANSNNIDIYSTDASYSGNQKEMFTFPSVLYFCHTECVNDFSCEIGSSEGWGTPEGYSQEFSVPYPPSSSAPSFFMPPGKSNEAESAHVVAVLLRKINGATRPPLRVMAQSHLVPYILPEPLRLNDYRHPAELCQDLVYRNNLYDQKLLLQKEVDAPRSLLEGRPLPSGAFSSSGTQRQGDSGSPLGVGSNGGFADSGGARPASPPATEEGGKEWERFLSPSACGIALPKDMYLPCSRFSHDGRSIQQRALKKDVLRIEMSVFQAFSQHLKDLLHILANEAFPDSIWSGGRPQNKNFSHTVHYVSIDKNAAQLQERMQLVNDSCIEELHWRCALLLRYSVDVVIEATATALQNVYEWIQQSFFDSDPNKIASIHHLSTIPSCFASAAPFPVTSSFTKTPLSHTAPTLVGTTSGGSSSANYRSNMTPKGHSSRKRSFNANHTSTAGSTESTTVPVFFPGPTKVPSTQEVVGNPPESFSLLHPSPAREVEPGVPLSLPLPPSVPRARRICEDKYRLSKERSIEFLSLLSQGEEKGLKCFWEAFRHRVLVPLQQELEEELREHIQYFTQVQEYQHQLLLFQARKTAQESIANVSCAVSTPTKEVKNGSVNGSSSRRNSRKGGGRSEGKDTSSQKGSTNRSGSASSSGGNSSSGGRGAAAAAPPLQGFPTLTSPVVAEQTHSFLWSDKHTDPVSELHWDSYIPCIVEIVLSKQMSSPLPTANEHYGTIDASRCPPLLPNSSHTRVQNTVTSLPPLHSTSAGGESKEPIFPSSLESTFTMEEGGEGETMLFSAGGGTRMGAQPSVPSHLSRSWLPNSSSEESHHPALRVSSSLGRILITIKEVLSCANGAKRSAQKWLETMYQTALATPTNEIFPDCMRPRTISQLFSAPPLHPSAPPVHQMTPTPLSPYASHSSDSNRETGVSFFTGEPSDTYIWPRLHLELLLSQFSIYEKDELSLEEFLHCASLSQLSQAWRYMNVDLQQLSLSVGYVRECREGSLGVGSGVVRQTSSIAADEKPAQASMKKRETTTSSTSGGNGSGRGNEVEKADYNQIGIVEGYVPDVLNIACLLRSPCREEPYRTLPFLSARELVNLFHRSTLSEEESREKSSGRPPLLNIRWWLFNVICRRFCFCQDHRCEFRRTVALPLPSPRELRQAVSLLPECVLYPPSTTIHLLPPYISRGKKEGRPVVKDQGVPLEWWSYETPRTEERMVEGRCAAAGTENVCSKAGSLALARHRGASSVKSPAMSTLKRALTRIATSSFCVSKYGVLRQAHPNLPLVLYLLSYYPDSIEDSVSRMFHCFAALMEKSPEPECFFESGGAASLAAAKVNLTVEEFIRLFSCFLHKRHSPLFTFPSSSSFIGGFTPPLPLQTPNVPSFSPGSALCFSALGTVLLEVDAQLLLQVEEKEKISLTTLLSSHWGRSLVRSHFT